MRLGKDLLEADLYGELGVEPDASAAQLRAAYRRSARRTHPDLNRGDSSAGRRMARLNVAARVLLDPALRRAYDSGRVRPEARREAATVKTPRAWYDRAARVSSEADSWAPAATAPEVAHEPQIEEFLGRLRGFEGRLPLRLDGWLVKLPRGQRRSLVAACFVAALGLFALSQPPLLTGRPQPTCVTAVDLYP